MGILGAVVVAIFLAWLLVNFVKTPANVYDNFQIGLTNGAVYGLIAIGYSLVYGILELINFAHGDVFMLGGMLTATLVASLSLRRASVVSSSGPRSCSSCSRRWRSAAG